MSAIGWCPFGEVLLRTANTLKLYAKLKVVDKKWRELFFYFLFVLVKYEPCLRDRDIRHNISGVDTEFQKPNTAVITEAAPMLFPRKRFKHAILMRKKIRFISFLLSGHRRNTSVGTRQVPSVPSVPWAFTTGKRLRRWCARDAPPGRPPNEVTGILRRRLIMFANNSQFEIIRKYTNTNEWVNCVPINNNESGPTERSAIRSDLEL